MDAHLATYDASGTVSGIDDRSIIAILVGAVKALAKKFNDLATTIAGFTEKMVTKELVATNGTFTSLTTEQLCAKKSDGTSVCVTGDQLAAVLTETNAGGPGVGGTGAPASQPLSSVGNATSSTSANGDNAPIIEINGANPAQINVGSTYADLGATITGPQADLNLGINTLLDGATTTELTLDTSAPGQHAIEYRVFDQNGLMGSVIRTVIVVAVNNNQATTTDASSTAQ